MRFVQVDAIRQQLDIGNVVLLTNLAYSPAGEVLSCNIYDVATHAAIEMEADKLICMTLKVHPLTPLLTTQLGKHDKKAQSVSPATLQLHCKAEACQILA